MKFTLNNVRYFINTKYIHLKFFKQRAELLSFSMQVTYIVLKSKFENYKFTI